MEVSKIVTIKDVAEKAEVSVATVSHVINDTRYVSPELTERVREAMEELGYRPNAVARSLKTDRTLTIGLIVSDISNSFFSSLVRGVEDSAMEKNYSLIVCNTDETLKREELYLNVLMEKKVDGLVIAPTGENDERLRRPKRRGIPLVFVDRKLDQIESDAVLSANESGAYLVTKHLISCGHRKIGILLGRKGVNTSQERLTGYERALKEEGIKRRPELSVRGMSRLEGGYRATEKLLRLKEGPSALFSTNLPMAIGALRALKEAGLSVPEDVSLAGFDDAQWASTFEPTLTTVAQDPYRMGSKAVELLVERLDEEETLEPREIRIPTELKIRNSTGPAGES